MSRYIFGDIVNEGGLIRASKTRSKHIKEITVDKPLPLKYKEDNWKIKKEYKQTLNIFKDKKPDELFEDKIWLLFKKMGFTEMNKDRLFKVGVGANMKQVDVYAKDENHIFIIECKSAENTSDKSLLKDMREILQMKPGIIESLRNYYQKDFKFTFLLVTKNINISKAEQRLAKDSVNKNFYIWTEADIQSYYNLTNQFGNHTKYVMYSILFGNSEIPNFDYIKVPAIYGGKGNNKYYYFIIQPEKLLNGTTYIHRKEEKNPQEIIYSYQRMLNKTRLTRIKEFVRKGGYFANNIILNFTSKPLFEKKDRIGDIVTGTLTFPKQYGSAWIIDGQHRLYGYLNSGKSEDSYIPVLAFENIQVKEQAKLFVDINKEQKPVTPGLLWELYSDIYTDSTDSKQQELKAISEISKKLNSEKDSPFYQIIKFPSQSKDIQKNAHITLTTICIAIKENRLIDKKENLLFDEDYTKSVGTAYDVIKEYFKAISNFLPEDWNKGEKGLICSNIGIRILFNIFRQLLKFLEFHEGRELYLANNKDKFNIKTMEILSPVVDKIKTMTPSERSKIRGESNKALIMKNTQKLVWDLQQKNDFGIELWKKGVGWNPGVPEDESDENIKKLIEDTEIEMKSFIINELKLIHGAKWWENGVPSNTKEYIKIVVEKDLAKIPFEESRLSSEPLEEKLRFISTSHIKELITNRNNWEQFKKHFARDQEIVSTAFKFYEAIRNKYAHPERLADLTDIEKGLGYYFMKWLRKCIGLNN